MKIVIDIPNEAYELLKNKQVLDNIAESIIANGTPYEERPQGKWKKIGEEYYNWCNHNVIKCSVCGYIKDTAYEHFPHFCEDCGADMQFKRVKDELKEITNE